MLLGAARGIGPRQRTPVAAALVFEGLHARFYKAVAMDADYLAVFAKAGDNTQHLFQIAGNYAPRFGVYDKKRVANFRLRR